MLVRDFDFDLPSALIAQEPAVDRSGARLLYLPRTIGPIVHSAVRELPALLKPGDLLVVNDTRVFPARLLGRRVPSGGAVECLLVARLGPDSDSRADVPSGISRTVDEQPGERWEALVHPGQKLKPGARMRFDGAGVSLHGEILARRFQGRRSVRLWTTDPGGVAAVVDRIGHVPLPPYIHRADTPGDRERYQTIFAAHRGSVAAPTAGLHFDDRLLADLARAGVERVTITLHVGYGTFKPIRTATVEAHVVDPEPYEISVAAADRINAALAAGRRVVAVGTTTTRALEDAARRSPDAVRSGVRPGAAEAELFIYPGFDFRVVSGLLTNFHLPQSSLLMLVSAFAGRERVLDAYREAVAQRYRFYSYGDAMLIR